MSKNPLPIRQPSNKAAFIQYDPGTKDGRTIANKASINLVDSYKGVSQTSARSTFKNFEPNISIREGFHRGDYENFRPDEEVPKEKKQIIGYCMKAYRKVGIVRNVIDLMGDFCVQGIKIVHPNKYKQRLLRKWAKKVNFKDVSERFANMMFRAGNVVIKRTMAKLPASEEDKMAAQAGVKLEPDTEWVTENTTSRRNIPYSYTFLNPTSLEIIGGELAQFTGQRVIALKITSKLKRQITNPTEDEKVLLTLVPDFVKKAVLQGRMLIPLEQEKLYTSYYKKDDWQDWADPMTYAVLDDLILLEKMKLADLAALDGAISQVRVWTLGDLERGILPTDAAIDKLAEILMSNPGGGAFDLIWGPDLKVSEYKTEVHKFLGGQKYEPVLRSIYAGLGVPPTLTGSDGASGATNNFVSIQTMVQRLEYVRSKITEFWEGELELVRQGLGFQVGGKIQYDRMTLSDEAAEKALLIDMWDRGLVTDETIQERFKEWPELEVIRSRREEKERKNGMRNQKSGPYFVADKAHEYIKTALGRGYVNPKDVGIEMPSGEESPFDKQLKSNEKVKSMGGGAGSSKKAKGTAGRPKNSKDKNGRKPRSFKMRTSAEAIENFTDFMTKNIWAKETQRTVNEVMNPILLKYFNKANLRELSDVEFTKAEKVKFAVLANLSLFDNDVSEDKIIGLIQSRCILPSQYRVLYDRLSSRAYDIHGREPNMEERKSIQASVYALLN